MDTETRARTLEGLLFAEAGPLSLRKLASLLECTEDDVRVAVTHLEANAAGRGLTVIRTETEVALGVSPESRARVAAILGKEDDRDIGDAGLEVLAVLLYEGPQTRADIDYIRGVNSSTTLRTLIARGLIERSGNPLDGREYVYRPTVELLAYLGVPNGQSLPDYATLSGELAAFKAGAAHITHGPESAPAA
jgi:segregation and condensation protein B